jgi:transglutaminase-like putative cysteine protease
MGGSYMKPESSKLDDYLAADDVVNWRHSAVQAKAQTIVAGVANDIDKARLLFDWVRDEIPHSKDIESDVVTCSASEVLSAGTGICFAKSHLLAAFLRSVGIPAGFCYQVLRRDPPFEGLVLHGLNGVFLPSLEKWIRVDPRGNIGDINAQFSTEREQLAFPMDSAAGEFLHETIYCSPAKVVVEVLTRFDNRTAMWPHLPTGLGNG